MTLDYHQSTFDLIAIQPCISNERVAAIAARERLCGCSFPKAIREWYSVAAVEDLFGSNELTAYDKLGHPSEVSQGYIRVATENQGVVAGLSNWMDLMIRLCTITMTTGTQIFPRSIGCCARRHSQISFSTRFRQNASMDGIRDFIWPLMISFPIRR